MKKMIFSNLTKDQGPLDTALNACVRPCRLHFSSIIMVILFALSAINPVAAGQHTNIAELRAAYYFNALKFTRWPTEHLSEQEPLNIVIVGSDPVSDILSRKLPDYMIKGRKLSISSVTQDQLSQTTSENLLGNAHAIYFASNTQANYPGIIEKLTQPVLTGSSIENFAEHGGMVEIAFEPTKQKLNFHINTGNLKDSSISISSTLMKISTIISDGGSHNGSAKQTTNNDLR